ncbi:OmpA family protein [Methylopila sp. M107]|uniref:OmpA family protein n=1 Tax=Methylopila sp. M107 TaxID=1101190 RepID=UPI00035C8173|nr:OmpA family protein [Methylopila sp. M107]
MRGARLLVGALGALVLWGPAAAQTVSSETIVNKLQPKPAQTRGLTRSFGPAAAAPAVSPEDKAFLQNLAPTRGLKQFEREKVAEIVAKQDLPKIDIQITFDYDSDHIRPSSIPDVNELGKALVSAQLANARLLLNGHTDAAGSPDYNQALSERRAKAIGAYLTARFGIGPERLIAIGYGKERLKNSAEPLAEENRRVEIVNLSQN